MPYQPIPKSEWKKPGPKPGTIGTRIKARMGSFNGFEVIPKEIPNSPKDFYSKASEILAVQMGKLHMKSKKSNLDVTQIRTLLEMIKAQLVLDSKQADLPQETSPEMLEAALKQLGKSQEPKETNERAENPTPTTKD